MPTKDQAVVSVTMSTLIAAFTEWDRRFREEPQRFLNEVAHLLQHTPKTYGEAAGPYFAQIVSAVQKR